MTQNILSKQELTLVKQKTSNITATVDSLKITSQKQLDVSVQLLSKITDTQKIVKDKKESMTKPLNESLRNIREFFSPLEIQLVNANQEVKRKMLEYRNKIAEKVQERKDEIVQKVETGHIDFDKASKQIEKADNKVSSIPTRTVKQVIIVDQNKIPDKYWEINRVLLRKDALAGIDIPGIKVEEKNIIVSK
jgi:hypothetical protein